MPVLALYLATHFDQIAGHHLPNELHEGRLVLPAKPRARFGRIAEQEIHLRRSKVSVIDLNQRVPCRRVAPLFVNAPASPFDTASNLFERYFDEFTNRVLFSG